MFAFAVWDRRHPDAHPGPRPDRDQAALLGPSCRDLLLFGSELKALRAHPGWTRRDRPGCAARLPPLRLRAGAAQHLSGNVQQACAGLSPDRGDLVSPARSRHIGPAPDRAAQARRAGLRAKREAAVDASTTLLRDAVGRRMVADVPLGAFLSGGIDSSTVTALMQAQSDRGRSVRSRSAFTKPASTRRPTRKAVAAHLGTAHTELYVEPADALARHPDACPNVRRAVRGFLADPDLSASPR